MSLLKEGPEAMDLEKPDPPKGAASCCSICLETVVYLHGRSTAKLQCGHEFHLDCIGSAFNAKGAMQCPNCRKVEKGQWLYANGHRPSTDFDLDSWVTEEVYDLSYSELEQVRQQASQAGAEFQGETDPATLTPILDTMHGGHHGGYERGLGVGASRSHLRSPSVSSFYSPTARECNLEEQMATMREEMTTIRELMQMLLSGSQMSSTAQASPATPQAPPASTQAPAPP